jgi:hypothetical protein
MTRWFPSIIFTAINKPPHSVFVLSFLPDSAPTIFLKTYSSPLSSILSSGACASAAGGDSELSAGSGEGACWGVDDIGDGGGEGVTLSAETRTLSTPCWRMTTRPSDPRTRKGPSAWSSSFGFTPVSCTSRRTITQEPTSNSLFFSRIVRS